MVKYKVGGITTAKSITFVGQKAKVTISDKEGKFLLKKWNNPANNKYADIPFIRGFIKLFSVFKLAIKTSLGKISLIFLGLSLCLILLSTVFSSTGSSNTVGIFNIFFDILSLSFIIGILIYILSIRNLHGIEHRLIETYNSGKDLTLNNVKKQNKESPQCGGTLIGIIILMEIIWIGLLNFPSGYLWLLFPSIGYEAFLAARGNKWYNKLLFMPGYLIQKITTGYNVSDNTIKKYLRGFRAFIKAEDS